MAVITISRQFGSGGDEIAGQVCHALGYRMFDKYMVVEAARESGLSEQDIIDYSEENHRVRGFLDRLFGGSMATSYTGLWPADIAAVHTAREIKLREEESLQLVRKAIWSAYKLGKMVIVGRGGQMILKDCPGVFHIRIVAPMEERIQHIKELLKTTQKQYLADIDSRREAQDMIVQRDDASADYIRCYYEADWENPILYHLVINTGKIGMKKAVSLIASLPAET